MVALWGCLFITFSPRQTQAAPYAAMVMDGRTGEVLYSTNADTRLHPASLTKMMTLYVAFEAVRNGEITMDTMVRVSKNAASEQPSKLGLHTGQKIALRYLVRAAAVKSANDAATAIGEAISGSEAAFARRMTRTAKALGMTRTTFKNAHGLTASGHLSTAHDMTILGRHLLYDYPEYYNLFSRRSTNAGIKTVTSHNRILDSYRGADGIKTGYTRAAGFNLVASAKRGDKRIIATVFGGKSSTSRNAKVAELLDLGFRRAPNRAPIRKPSRPAYAGNSDGGHGQAGKVVRLVGAVQTSLRPIARPGDSSPATTVDPELVARSEGGPDADVIAAAVAEAILTSGGSEAPTQAPRPEMRPDELREAVLADASTEEPIEPQEIVTRLSTSGERHWGINVGRYPNRYQAEKTLLRTALSEMETLDGTLRKVVHTQRGFDANFMGMSEESAELACRRLKARNLTCNLIAPS
ncbi:D-alanyl-D-alanine carboxypeptidase family protein [Pseudodonghicola flavimaris]|uniref:D-alanyl-D-alanine carboxypeptidase family protein n=1 Tax=Pseudodonghicola flavimaris TaxID=3050036 RepID=A0ABT7EXC6_9RHOB|nr:D-alanyl-D-alanine carboxypeptidase family protein [Pseudodonghicola flavimaris]MDK3016983.1 D-alanyl-D-alanine carboxypeptidase family protein [Pseudodonghicola flavimaris]